MNRKGTTVTRCPVERMLLRLGLQGVRRGKVVRTTVQDKAQPCRLDHVNRQFNADYTEPPAQAETESSMGSRGVSYENALV